MNMQASTVLKMATRWGARVLGLEQEIGTLEAGKKADLIVVDLRSPHMVPLYHPISTLVYAASGGDVKDVMVNGKILMRDRRMTQVDTEEVMAKVREISKRIST
jgi:5-methylthioadenosine/S-adenosylhomocysteine deaminase